MGANRSIMPAAWLLVGAALPPAASAAVIVPGLASSQLDPGLEGLVLIEELNCVACHASEGNLAGRSKKAPRLSAVGSRVNPAYLQAFIRDPHGVVPGTTMPDVLAAMDPVEKGRAAEALTHFLLSLKAENSFAPQAPDAVAARHGERLFHQRGCAACHSPRDAEGRELLPATSAPLGRLELKYSQKGLVEFLRRPHAVRPSGRMPDLRLEGREVEQIAHYLLRDTRVPGHLAYTLYRGQVWEGVGSDAVEAERAGQVADFSPGSLGTKVHHHTALEYRGWLKIARPGRYTFFLHANGGSLHLGGEAVIEQEPSNRRGTKKVEGPAELAAGWHEVRLTYFHTGRNPVFSFEMEGPGFKRGPVPSSLLSVSREPVPAFAAPRVDAGLAARGRALFGELGCARCHDDVGVSAEAGPALAELNPGRGCLGEKTGRWPSFDLEPSQRDLINGALEVAERRRLDDRQLLDKSLVTFNCIACHEREGVGGVDPGRDALFTGTREELGNQGRLPPPLTHVGAKLTPAWMEEVLLRGGRQRGYSNVRMPHYGEANVGHLAELFGRVDRLEPAGIPAVADADVGKFRSAGHEMMGTDGLSCIACHDFNGQEAGGPGALDLVHTTGRVQKNWFHLYLRNPARFHPTGIMPTYWPGSQSVRPEFLGGDPARQIEALWVYLQDGGRAKKPAGLSRQSTEIRVSDVAEIVRGRGTAGFRGIGVGYPERINLAFDSEEMALRLLWKGDFANVNHGSFRARGGDRVAFPAGIPFHRLESMDESWPYKGKTDYAFPHDHGYQFRGYDLDAARRPTFRYRYGDVWVEDFFEDVPGEEGEPAWFRRTIRFDTEVAPERFYFRAAAGKKINRGPGRAFTVDRLRVVVTGGQAVVVREGEPAELLVPLDLPAGASILTLEYRW